MRTGLSWIFDWQVETYIIIINRDLYEKKIFLKISFWATLSMMNLSKKTSLGAENKIS